MMFYLLACITLTRTGAANAWLRNHGHQVNRKRVRRLMQLIGLEAIYRRPNTSKPNPGHKVYPYLLRGLEINRVNQVWATDCWQPAKVAHFETREIMGWMEVWRAP